MMKPNEELHVGVSLVQPLDETLVVLLRVLHHPRQRVREPLLEVGVRLEAVQASISDRLDLPW